MPIPTKSTRTGHDDLPKKEIELRSPTLKFIEVSRGEAQKFSITKSDSNVVERDNSLLPSAEKE